MISEQLQHYIEHAWELLPQSYRAAILHEDYKLVPQGALSGTGLDSENLAYIQREVLFVLLGLQTVEDFDVQITGSGILIQDQTVTFLEAMHNFFSGLNTDDDMQSRQEAPPTAHGFTATNIHTAIDAYGLVRERLERLPQTVQVTVRSQQLEDGLASLLSKHQVDQRLAPVFVAEAVRVMVGLTTTNNFKTEVTRSAGWDPNKLDALFLDTESVLFKPVRMAIMQALEQKQGGSASQSTSSTPAPNINSVPTPPRPDPYREQV